MPGRTPFVAAIVIVALLAAGNAADALLSDNAMSDNAMSDNLLSDNLLSDNRLSEGPLSTEALAPSRLPDPGLLDTAIGRELLAHTVRCAFRADQELVVNDSTGARHVFQGLVGLAPTWATAGLDASDLGLRASQRWITACLLAHTNAFGIKTTVSLRGNHPALSTISDVEASMYSSYEVTFYGNVFTPGSAEAFGCEGDSVLKGSHGGPSGSYLQWRVCGSAAQCGVLASLGYCSPSRTRTNLSSQSVVDGTVLPAFYAQGTLVRVGYPVRGLSACRGEALQTTSSGDSFTQVTQFACKRSVTDARPSYEEAISVYVTAADAKRLRDRCLDRGGCLAARPHATRGPGR